MNEIVTKAGNQRTLDVLIGGIPLASLLLLARMCEINLPWPEAGDAIVMTIIAAFSAKAGKVFRASLPELKKLWDAIIIRIRGNAN
jgi:MFS superfamily sulfate permease-like transporter